MLTTYYPIRTLENVTRARRCTEAIQTIPCSSATCLPAIGSPAKECRLLESRDPRRDTNRTLGAGCAILNMLRPTTSNNVSDRDILLNRGISKKCVLRLCLQVKENEHRNSELLTRHKTNASGTNKKRDSCVHSTYKLNILCSTQLTTIIHSLGTSRLLSLSTFKKTRATSNLDNKADKQTTRQRRP